MVVEYLQSKRTQVTQGRFNRRFPNSRVPHRATILKNVNKYKAYGTSRNRNKEASGHPRTARSQANVQLVTQALQQDPNASARRNNVPNLSKSSFNRITKRDIKWHPYKMNIRHKLEPQDNARRIQYCQWLLQQRHNFMNNIVIGDEAVFQMNGHVSNHNVHSYAPKGHPPQNFNFDKPHSREKVTVWCGLTSNRIIGPYFFDGNVNGAAYLNMIDNFVQPQLINLFGLNQNGSIPRAWWFQDGAPGHRLIAVHDRLQDLFRNRVVGLGHAREWPPRSPALTPLDFFFWGYVKSLVYKTPPVNIIDLRQRITDAVQQIRRTRMVRHAVLHMRARAQNCIVNQGGHIEGRDMP